MGGREFGAATKDGIAREQIEPTLAYLAQLGRVPREDLIALGSAGKKPRSGDLDVAIDSNKYDEKQFAALVQRLASALGDEHHLYRAGLRTHSFSVPIAGDEKNGRVQVDFKHNDGEFLQFSHYSAEGERSRYKGAVRSYLIASLVSELREPGGGKDAEVKEKGRVVVDVRWGFDTNAGLKRMFRMCKMTQKGDRRKAELENVTPAEIKKDFPELDFDKRARVITDPDKIAAQIFGKGVKASDLDTAEDVIRLIRERHPEALNAGFVARVSRGLKKMNLEVPSELTVKPPELAPAAEKSVLADATLPKVELEWREFHRTTGKKTRAWMITLMPDGESFRTREGTLGGELRESPDIRPGGRGREGQRLYVSAADACRQEVDRRILNRRSNGYGELVEGVIDKTELTVDFSKPFPRSFYTPKPQEEISVTEHRRIQAAGHARITRKYDGMGLIVARHTFGWEMYTLEGNRMGEFFPKHLEALAKTPFKEGTLLKAEAIMFSREHRDREDFRAVLRTFPPSRKAAEVRRIIDSGEEVEPAFVFYDILYADGKKLGDVSYDERSKHWRQFPAARTDNGLLLSAEYYPDVTAENWRKLRLKHGFEGFVLVDGSSTLGENFISYSSHPRPLGSYKLKPNVEQDVVVYAVRQVDGKYESVFVKQRYPENYPGTDIAHPRAGEWFASGRVSLLAMKDVVAKVAELADSGRIKVVASNKEGERIDVSNDYGVVATIEFFERFPSNKFRHPQFVQPARFRDEGADYKSPADCTATILGTPSPKLAAVRPSPGQ